MVGKQIINNLMEVVFPWLKRKLSKYCAGKEIHDEDGIKTRWEHDYALDSSNEIITGIL